MIRNCFVSLTFSLILLLNLPAVAQFNLIQRSYISFNRQTTAGVWHYVDSLQHEYALVGTQNGISIVNVTNPVAPVFVLQVPGITNRWHEVRSWGKFAYAVTEGTAAGGINDGLQIIDLRYLPDSAPVRYWHGDGAIAGQLHKAHSIEVADGYVYINGHNILSLHQGVIIADIADPWNPHFVGADKVRYCHDSYIRGDSMWTSDLTAGFSVYDISNKAVPVYRGSHSTPSNFNHNSGLSDNGKVLFTTDEHNHAPLASYDVSNLNNIELLDKYKVVNIVGAGPGDEVHNVRVLNDFLINSCYGSQVTIVDGARPHNLVEVGNFPIYASLAWDADPYLPSGNILATGDTGLYILHPTYTRACYLEGVVTDSVTTIAINNVLVEIQSTYMKDSTDIDGIYWMGFPTAGTYDIRYSKTGYITKVISGVVLNNGVLDSINVELVPINTGLKDELTETKNSIIPNPFHLSAELFFDMKITDHQSAVNLVITDKAGRVVQEISNVQSSPIKIFRNQLGSGMYFYEVRNAVKSIAKGKLIIE